MNEKGSSMANKHGIANNEQTFKNDQSENIENAYCDLFTLHLRSLIDGLSD